MTRNIVVVSGAVVKVEPLRYTPSGLSVIEMILHHRSAQQEVGHEVVTEFEIRVWVAGDMAHRLSTLCVGQRLVCRGFLAPPSRHSRQLVLRADTYQLIEGHRDHESE